MESKPEKSLDELWEEGFTDTYYDQLITDIPDLTREDHGLLKFEKNRISWIKELLKAYANAEYPRNLEHVDRVKAQEVIQEIKKKLEQLKQNKPIENG
jgi:hypothetical protein